MDTDMDPPDLYNYEQAQDDLNRQWLLLKALQKIDRAGFHDEALLFAFEGGVLDQFKKEIAHA